MGQGVYHSAWLWMQEGYMMFPGRGLMKVKNQ